MYEADAKNNNKILRPKTPSKVKNSIVCTNSGINFLKSTREYKKDHKKTTRYQDSSLNNSKQLIKLSNRNSLDKGFYHDKSQPYLHQKIPYQQSDKLSALALHKKFDSTNLSKAPNPCRNTQIDNFSGNIQSNQHLTQNLKQSSDSININDEKFQRMSMTLKKKDEQQLRINLDAQAKALNSGNIRHKSFNRSIENIPLVSPIKNRNKNEYIVGSLDITPEKSRSGGPKTSDSLVILDTLVSNVKNPKFKTSNFNETNFDFNPDITKLKADRPADLLGLYMHPERKSQKIHKRNSSVLLPPSVKIQSSQYSSKIDLDDPMNLRKASKDTHINSMDKKIAIESRLKCLLEESRSDYLKNKVHKSIDFCEKYKKKMKRNGSLHSAFRFILETDTYKLKTTCLKNKYSDLNLIKTNDFDFDPIVDIEGLTSDVKKRFRKVENDELKISRMIDVEKYMEKCEARHITNKAQMKRDQKKMEHEKAQKETQQFLNDQFENDEIFDSTRNDLKILSIPRGTCGKFSSVAGDNSNMFENHNSSAGKPIVCERHKQYEKTWKDIYDTENGRKRQRDKTVDNLNKTIAPIKSNLTDMRSKIVRASNNFNNVPLLNKRMSQGRSSNFTNDGGKPGQIQGFQHKIQKDSIFNVPMEAMVKIQSSMNNSVRL